MNTCDYTHRYIDQLYYSDIPKTISSNLIWYNYCSGKDYCDFRCKNIADNEYFYVHCKLDDLKNYLINLDLPIQNFTSRQFQELLEKIVKLEIILIWKREGPEKIEEDGNFFIQYIVTKIETTDKLLEWIDNENFKNLLDRKIEIIRL
jgi:hypothetical protein